jgi:hypothetical protein
MKDIFKLLVLFLILSPIYNQTPEKENKKIQIEVLEIKEEIPFYRTFQIKAFNPNSEDKTLTGKILFDDGSICHFYFELKENEKKELIKHCKVQKRRSNYNVLIEKVFPFIIQE